jgi:hypothetical protein
LTEDNMGAEHVEVVVEKAELVRVARAELRAAIREAHAAGEPLSAIGGAAGLSKQRIHQILKKGRGKNGGSLKKGRDDA